MGWKIRTFCFISILFFCLVFFNFIHCVYNSPFYEWSSTRLFFGIYMLTPKKPLYDRQGNYGFLDARNNMAVIIVTNDYNTDLFDYPRITKRNVAVLLEGTEFEKYIEGENDIFILIKKNEINKIRIPSGLVKELNDFLTNVYSKDTPNMILEVRKFFLKKKLEFFNNIE